MQLAAWWCARLLLSNDRDETHWSPCQRDTLLSPPLPWPSLVAVVLPRLLGGVGEACTALAATGGVILVCGV